MRNVATRFALVFLLGIFARPVGAAPGDIDRFAGTGAPGFSGDGGPAIAAQFNECFDIAFDGDENLYVADTQNHRVRKITPAGVVMPFAGDGDFFHGGDLGPATEASLNTPRGVAVDPLGNVLIATHGRIRRVNVGTGTIQTIAGTGNLVDAGDGGLAVDAMVAAGRLAVDATGNIYVLTSNRIRRIDPDGMIDTIAGTGAAGFSGDGGPAILAEFNFPHDIAVDPAGHLFVADSGNNRIRRVDKDTGIITTVAGDGTFGGPEVEGPALTIGLGEPRCLAFDGDGNLYLGYVAQPRVVRIASDGFLTRFAGTGVTGAEGDGGPALEAEMTEMRSLAVDAAGNVYVAEPFRDVIRRIEAPIDVVPVGVADLWIGSRAGNLRGNDIFATGVGQSIVVRSRRGGKAVALASLENDGTSASDFILRAKRGNRKYRVTYLIVAGGRRNISGAAVRGNARSGELNAGQIIGLRIEARPMLRYRKRNVSFPSFLQARPAIDPGFDRVNARFKNQSR